MNHMDEMLSSAREERKQAQNEVIKLEERLKQLLTESDKRTSLISQVENLEHEHKAYCDKLELLNKKECYAMGNLSGKFALTPQEMEILHVKSGWICYYWELAAKYGYKDAEAKHDHWKNLCLQYDSNVVVCAGEATSGKILNLGSSPVLDLNNVETEFIDSMDEVEMGMVKQGLHELRKLGIECKLWNALRDRTEGIIYRKDEWDDGQTS